jgi:hypothetical protein
MSNAREPKVVENRSPSETSSNQIRWKPVPPTIDTVINHGHDSSIRTSSLLRWMRERLFKWTVWREADHGTNQATLGVRTCGYGFLVRSIQ